MTAGAGAGPFPLPGIGPPHRPMSRSRRVVARYQHSARVTALANHSIAALNELYSTSHHSLSSFPSLAHNHSSPHHHHSPPPVTAIQERLRAHVYRCAQRFEHRRRSLDACGDALLSPDTDLFLHSLVNPTLAHTAAYSSLPSTAVPLIAARVALPQAAGAVDMMAVLPADVADFYRSGARCLRADAAAAPATPSPARGRAPSARFFGSHREYLLLLQRMRAASMVDFTTAPRAVNGLFGVEKPDGALRLIIDGRPANAAFTEPPPVELPTPDLLARLTAPPDGSAVWVAKSDLADFFYRFRIPEWMRPWFALPPVRAAELPGLSERFGADTTVHPCLTVLAMGWSHSVFITQTAHTFILDQETVLRPADRITHRSDLRLDRVRHLVYVDDLIILGPDRALVTAAQRQYLSAVAARRLPAKPSKVVEPSCDGVDCLGIEVHGASHTVGLSAAKLLALCTDTRALLVAGTATGRELARIVGRWTWAMLPVRPALAVFSAVYRYVACAGRRSFSLWPSVRRELWLAVRLSPLLFVDWSSPWFDRVVACDSSLDGLGVCAARAPVAAVTTAAAHCGVPPVTADSAAEAAIDAPLLAADWRTIVAAPWRSADEHINQLELRAVSTAVRWVLSSPSSISRRLLLLSDSQVAVGALTKGRSSAFSLLSRVRPISALLLASGVQLFVRWLHSADNPADGPSRVFSRGDGGDRL